MRLVRIIRNKPQNPFLKSIKHMPNTIDVSRMAPKMTIEETIKMLEDLHKSIPTLIFLLKLSQLEIAQANAHLDDAGVEAVEAQGHLKRSAKKYIKKEIQN
ncbi:hypothetical protein ES705_31779 [subsurface metagenome]